MSKHSGAFLYVQFVQANLQYALSCYIFPTNASSVCGPFGCPPIVCNHDAWNSVHLRFSLIVQKQNFRSKVSTSFQN